MNRDRVKITGSTSIFLRHRTWWADIRGGGHRKQRNLRTSDRTEAMQLALDLQTEKNPAQLQTLQDALDRYMAEYSPLHHRPGTGKRYQQVIQTFIERVGPNALPSQITRRHVTDFQSDRKARVAPDTVNGDMGYIKAFINWCRAEGLMEHDPCFKVKRIKVNRKRRRTLTPNEVTEILTAVEGGGELLFGSNRQMLPLLHDYVTVAANTGMRPNEILHVRGCDLDASRTLLHLTAWGDWQTKDAEDRSISLNAEALDVLARRKMAIGNDALPLFVGRNGVVRDFHNVSRELKKRLPDYLDWVGLYDFRHYFATESVKQDWSAERLRVYMGHTEISTTLRYYADLRAEHVGAPPILTGAERKAPPPRQQHETRPEPTSSKRVR